MSKPSDVAMGLADRFTLNAIRAAHALKQDFCTDAGCVCGGHQLVRDAALTIDAAIQRAVEAEMAKQIQDRRDFSEVLRRHWSFNDGQMHTHSWHDREDFIRDILPGLLAALRATPNTGG